MNYTFYREYLLQWICPGYKVNSLNTQFDLTKVSIECDVNLAILGKFGRITG